MELLTNLGLTTTEACLYAALLGFSGLTVSELVKETALQRTTIYHALETLMQKGLVTKRTTGGTLSFSANEARSLARYLDFEINSLQSKKQELEKALVHLERTAKNKIVSTKVEQSEGAAGIKNIIEQALYCRSRQWEIVAPKSNFFSQFDAEYARYFLQTRLENRITTRSLWERAPGKRVLTEQEIANRNPRILPEAAHGMFATVMILFDDKIAFIPSLAEKTAVLIQSQEIYKTMYAVFEGLWVNAKPYKENIKPT